MELCAKSSRIRRSWCNISSLPRLQFPSRSFLAHILGGSTCGLLLCMHMISSVLAWLSQLVAPRMSDERAGLYRSQRNLSLELHFEQQRVPRGPV